MSEDNNDLIQGALDNIDKRIARIAKMLHPFEDLIEQRNKLQAARRALLNDRATTSGGGRGITQAEVVNAIGDDVLTVHEIAQKLGTTEAVVRGHLNRGKERFEVNVDNGIKKWQLRDPEEQEDE